MHSTNTHFTQWFHFCPHCKTELEVKPYLVSCPNCAFVDYLNPAPCVTLMVIKDDTMLFAKRAIEPHKGAWDLPGGFVNPGEMPIEAAQREITEETGLVVTDFRQFGEPLPDMYGNRPTLCTFYVGGEFEGELQAQDDVAELQWIQLSNLPLEEMPFKSISKALTQWLKINEQVY